MQGQSFTNTNCKYDSGSHEFLDCSWDNEELGNNGCAIEFNAENSGRSGSLNVKRCSFFHCHSSGNVGSGGVAAFCISSASVSDSFFYDCSCPMSETQEGGGVFIGNLSVQPLIRCCSFISCESADDGGGCGIWYSASSFPYAVDSCCFIKCKGTDEAHSEGGGVILWDNNKTIGISNSLFSGNHAVSGGAIDLYDVSPSTFSNPLKFYSFDKNTGRNGNDILFSSRPPSYPLLQCFSTTASSRIYNGENDWTHSKQWSNDCAFITIRQE